MHAFLDIVLAFPTVIFSALLVVVVLFWGFVILGALDFEMFDVDHDVDGLHHGYVEGLDFDGDADHDGSHGEGLLSSLGLAGVPVTIAASFLALFGFVASVLLNGSVTTLLGGGALAATIVGLVSFGVAVPVSSLCIRPLRKLYVSHDAVRRRSLVGQVCTITTQKVTEGFGQAEIEDGGAGLLVQVRSRRENTLTRLSRAVVFDYDPKEEVFLVAPLDEQGTLPEPR